MNRILNIFKAAALTVCAAAALVSCTEKEDTVAKAVLGTQSALNFSAKSAEAQVITVYSDGDWHSTVPSWITVDPATGNGVTDVTVSVSDNVDAQGLLEPRSDSLIFSGNTLASRLIVIVSQEGDAYRNAQHLTVDKIAALEDGKTFVLDEAAVVAVSTAGCVVSDGTVNLYAKTATEVKLGDKVSVKGFKGTLNGVPCISQVDELKVLSSGTASYPAPQDITAGIDTYAATSSDYITVSGLVAGGNLKVTVADVEYSVKQVDVPAELSISKLNGNKVDLTGYSVGILGAKMIGIVTTALKDNGPAVVPRPEKLLYAKWRFTTNLYKNYESFFGGTAGKIDQSEGFGGLYVPSNIEGNGKLEYWQVDKTATGATDNPKRIIGATGHPYVTGAWPGDYWLFSATDNYEYPAGTTLHIKYLTRVSKTGHKYWMLEYFDGAEWKPAEEYPVAVETETGSNASYNFIEQTSNVAVECSWTLAVPCKEPKFRMRCVANWQAQGGALEKPNAGTCRIADNDDDGEDAGPVFEVLDAPAEGGGSTGGTVYEDDFEWLAPFSESLGASDSVADDNPSGSAPNVFTCAQAAELVAAFTEKGYGYFFSKKGDTEFTYDLTNNPNVLYIQKNYLKFGKSDYSAGIILPALSALKSASDITVEFDWCWQVTGSYNADIMTLQLDVKNGGTFENNDVVSEELSSTQSTESKSSHLAWQHATVKVKGATAKTVLQIRPTNPDPYVSNPDRGQNRWYLDNIKITK